MTNGDNLPNPSEVDVGNIIKPSLEELSKEHRRAYEEYKKAREEKELQEFLGNSRRITKAILLRLEKSSSLLSMLKRLNPL